MTGALPRLDQPSAARIITIVTLVRAAGAMETAKGPRIAIRTPIAGAAGPAPGTGSTTGDARARAATNQRGMGDGRPGGIVPPRRLRPRVTSPWPRIPTTRSPRPVVDPRLDLARGPGPRRAARGFPSARLAPVAVRPWATARATGKPELRDGESGRATTARATEAQGRTANAPGTTARAVPSRNPAGGARAEQPAGPSRTLQRQETQTTRRARTPARTATAP